MERIFKTSERLFFAMVWIVIILLAVGFTLKFMADFGILPGVARWIGMNTNLEQQAGG